MSESDNIISVRSNVSMKVDRIRNYNYSYGSAILQFLIFVYV